VIGDWAIVAAASLRLIPTQGPLGPGGRREPQRPCRCAGTLADVTWPRRSGKGLAARAGSCGQRRSARRRCGL